jgi:DNA-binding response OmpR family regulator
MNKDIRILLVDDDPDFVQPVEFWLKSKGYTVVVAPEGKSAIKSIKKGRPNIVFLDLVMPQMDGIETLRNIRKFDKELPVIIVTAAYADEKKFIEAKKLGISGFFPKKSDFAELENMIGAALRTHKDMK